MRGGGSKMGVGKAIFIIPYFGHFNNYFQLFLNSCAYNKDFDWLIFTDDQTNYKYPHNVRVEYCSFQDIQNKFREKFDFNISLERPYKLCDFKPAYGYIFYDKIQQYDFWGHCDTDLIWGKIGDFITDDLLEKNDKIGIMGHCTLYRNTPENNSIFLKKLNGMDRAKEVLQSTYNYSFDEEFNLSINNLFEEYNKKIDYTEYEANIYTKSSDFKITKMDINTKKYFIEKRKRSFFLWDRGKLLRYSYVNEKIETEEYMYIHMQSREMKIKNSSFEIYKIIPNAFENIEVSAPIEKNFFNVKIKNFNLHYFKLRSHNLVDKLKKKFQKICSKEKGV